MTVRVHEPARVRRAAQSYFMWEHISEQPAAIAETLARNDERISRFAARLARRDTVTLTGLGSSLHAAMLGECWLRAAGMPHAMAVNSFELEHYFPAPQAQSAVIGISHRGSRRFTGRRARAGSILHARICGEQSRARPVPGEELFVTTALEKSGAHTKSVTAALAILHRLAAEVALMNRRRELAGAMKRELEMLPERFRARIGNPSAERAAARHFRRFHRIVAIAAGPNYPAALEAALKLKETTFAYAEALEVEQFLHGPIAAVDRNTLAILISAGGAGARRIAAAARALGEIGAARLGVATEADRELAPLADEVIRVEGRDESASPFGVILSMQLFAYFSALARGCDPDRNRRGDPRYSRAARHYES